jgi:anti-sigma factor RsiW
MHDERRCRELLEALSGYVDGSASQAVCQEIQNHLKDCPDCTVVVNTLRKTISLYHRKEAPGSLPDEVRDRLFRALNLDDLIPGPTHKA